MHIRERILANYLEDEEVYDTIGHDFLIYIKIFAKYGALLLCLTGVWYVVDRFVVSYVYVDWGVALMGLLLYIKGTIDILDAYLDALVVTNMGLILFRWDGMFKQKTISLQWVSIETVAYEQNSFRDALFHKGDIGIMVEDEHFTFKDASKPKRAVSKILDWKEKILGRFHYSENVPEIGSKDKYEVLVEALGEVVSEYVEKKKY